MIIGSFGKTIRLWPGPSLSQVANNHDHLTQPNLNSRILTALMRPLTLVLFVFFGACSGGEQALISRASEIQKGMGIEEVTKILGPPGITAIIESSKIPLGWDAAWKASYEEMLENHDRLLFYNYNKGNVHIDVCFDLENHRVIYVSRFYSTG